MIPEFGNIEPPPPERPKKSAEHIVWDELLSDPPPPVSPADRVFDWLLVVGSVAGAVGAAVVALVEIATALVS